MLGYWLFILKLVIEVVLYLRYLYSNKKGNLSLECGCLSYFNNFFLAKDYDTHFFNCLPGLNLGTVAALIVISAPVCGLRPLRALLFAT